MTHDVDGNTSKLVEGEGGSSWDQSSRGSTGWSPVGLILEGDDWQPGDIGILLNGPIGYGYGVDDVRKFAAAPDLADALARIAHLSRPGQELGLTEAIDVLCDVWNAARSPLARAEGQTP